MHGNTMATIRKCNFIFHFVTIICFQMILAQGITEYCNGEVFEADCSTNEVLVMTSAVYGGMELGKCLEEDHGFLGCQNDALSIIDRECSGKQSCSVIISNRKLWEDVPGSCRKSLAGYARISYTCKSVHQIRSEYCAGKEIHLSSESNLIASSSLAHVCSSSSSAPTLRLSADRGQRLNITLWNFNTDAERRQSYGTLKDEISGNMAELNIDTRREHLMTTIGNTAQLILSRISANNNFLLDIKILGCKEMTPPEGAWMTRDGDIIEIGCHSGSKSWSLNCVNNEWIGVLGQCGTEPDITVTDPMIVEGEIWSVSINVFLFGVSSVVIFISACIFLTGVIILKRKLVTRHDVDYVTDAHTPRLMQQSINYDQSDQNNAFIFQTDTNYKNTAAHNNKEIYHSLKN